MGPNALDGLGKCLADEDLKQVVIYFGNGLIDLFGMKVMESLKESGVSVLEYRELDTVAMEDIITLAFSMSNKAKAVLAIGGGKVIDAGKYAAYLRGLPFISIPTSSSRFYK